MKITKIAQQVKRADRFSVYVDEVYTFSVNEAQLIEFGLHSGLELSKEDIERYKTESDTGKLFDKILNLLSIRPRSEWEVRDYLRRKKAEPEQIEILLNKLRKYGYIDDEKFARMWVENRRLLKATSRRKLQLELSQKRVSRSVIENVLTEDKQETDERDVLRQIVKKKRHRYPDHVKFMQYLARQGFGYEDIKAVLSEIDHEV